MFLNEMLVFFKHKHKTLKTSKINNFSHFIIKKSHVTIRSYILGFVKQLVMIGAGVKEDELQVLILFFIVLFISIIILIIRILIIIVFVIFVL